MRRRWHWKWKVHGDDLLALTAGWFMLWAVVLVTVAVTTHKGRWWWLDTLNANTMVVPFVFPVFWYGLRGLWSGARWLRTHPPIRREWESVEDMRQVHRRES